MRGNSRITENYFSSRYTFISKVAGLSHNASTHWEERCVTTTHECEESTRLNRILSPSVEF